MALVSIIVPIYNTSKYLADCIESIVIQTYKEIEIILIDDGSTDSSAVICDLYAKKDTRIRFIRKKNEGVSIARNFGIELAKGEFIQFVDSDDTIANDMVERLVESIFKNKSDMVVCGLEYFIPYRLLKKNKHKEIKYLGDCNCIFTIEDYLVKVLSLKTNVIIGSPCNKLYRVDYIRKYGLTFENSVFFAEDFLFNLKVLEGIKKISYISESFYIYRRDRADSLTKSERNMDDYWYRNKHNYLNYRALFITLGYYDKYKPDVDEYLIFAVEAVLYDLFYSQPGIKFKEKIAWIKRIAMDSEVKNMLDSVICENKNEKAIVKDFSKATYRILAMRYFLRCLLIKSLRIPYTIVLKLLRRR